MVEEVRRLGSQCGISLPSDDIAFISQIIMGYLAKRPDGRRYLFKLFEYGGFKTEQASYLKTYYKEGYFGMPEHKLPYDKLKELKLYLYDNKTVVPFDMVEVMERPDQTACEDCGVLVPTTYCSATVKEWNNGREHVVTLCNHCRINKEDLKIRDTGKRATCEDCKVTGCHNWKDYHRKELAGDPAERSGNPFEEKARSPQERYSSL
jgi:hypothetical protein